MEKSIFEKRVRGLVKKQALRIIYKDIKKYNHYWVQGAIQFIYSKEGLDTSSLRYPVAVYYKREKERLQRKFTRIKQNKNISLIKNNYPYIDVELLAYYISLSDILNYKHLSHYEKLEKIIKIVVHNTQDIKNKDYNFSNFKHIKNLQNEYQNINILFLAEYIHSFKGFQFRKKDEAEILSNIVKIILSIPIAIEKSLKLKDWQVRIKMDMEKQNKIILKEIEKNKKVNQNT